MDCPRCGREGTLTQYALGDRTAAVCERCGFVGVPVDHESERKKSESWEEALTRFFGDR